MHGHLKVKLTRYLWGKIEVGDLCRVILKLRKLRLHSNIFCLDHGMEPK